MKKAIKILKNIVTVFLLLILAIILVQRISNNNLAIGGIKIFTIISESMEPDYRIGDILVARRTPPQEINVGDRVTYLGKEAGFRNLIITHEVIERREEDGKYYFTTQGIANPFPDPEISEDDIYGKVIYQTVIFSFFGRLMKNLYFYYGFFAVVALMVSYQLISGYLVKKDEKNE